MSDRTHTEYWLGEGRERCYHDARTSWGTPFETTLQCESQETICCVVTNQLWGIFAFLPPPQVLPCTITCGSQSLNTRFCPTPPNPKTKDNKELYDGFGAGLNFSTTRPGSVLGVRTGCGGGGGVGV